MKKTALALTLIAGLLPFGAMASEKPILTAYRMAKRADEGGARDAEL